MTYSEDGKSTENEETSRRSYLKATVGAAALGLAATGTSAADSDYDVIEVPAGQTHRVRLGAGDTLENVIIDVTADGAGYDIDCSGSDGWAIRNVGIRGQTSTSDIRCRVTDPAGSAVIENVYLPGNFGDHKGDGGGAGIYFYWNHAGDCLIRNAWIEDYNDQGIYGSAPGNGSEHTNPGSGGTVRCENIYAVDNQGANIRLGTDGSYAKNCVMNHGVHRGYWGYYEHTELIDCDIGFNNWEDLVVAGPGGSWQKQADTSVTLTNTRFETDNNPDSSRVNGSSAGSPRDRIPEGVPTSPEEAASGTSSSDDPVDEPDEPDDSDESEPEFPEDAHLVSFVTEPEARYANYEFSAAGEIEPTEAPYESPSGNRISADGITVEEADGVYSASGLSGGGFGDAYEVYGPVTDVSVEQPDVMWIELDGEEVSEEELIDRTNGEGDDGDDLENTILVDGVGTGDTTRYEFTVSGAAEHSTYKGASIDDEDTIDSGTVTGAVAGWRDAFRFSGELEELTVDGTARVYVNDERVDPAEYGEDQPHVLTLVGNGSDASYEITVDGSISAANDDADDRAEIVSDQTVEGSIERGVQRFRFSGVLTDVTFLDGSAHVYLDDERIDPDTYGNQELLPNAVVIDGTDSDSSTTYSFEIDGEVVTASYRDASVDPGDEIDGRSVSGTVDDSVDAYWFDGDIVDFRLAGNATVDVEYDVHGR